MNSKRSRHRYKRAGISLIEMLAYVAIFSVVINLSMLSFSQVLRLHSYSELTIQRHNALREFEAAFTKNVHNASAILTTAGAFTSGPDTLVLALQPNSGTPGVEQIAVIGKDSEGVIHVSQGEWIDGQWRLVTGKRFPIPEVTLELTYQTASPATSNWVKATIHWPGGRDPKIFTTIAALRPLGGSQS